MADKKISALTGATTPLAGTEVLPIVQSGATVKVAVSDLTAGRAVATAAMTATGIVSTSDATDASSTTAASMKTAGGLGVVKKIYVGDNIVQATAAKGVNFTANTPSAGMTSQLLNWYEEGTWTPSLGGTTTYSVLQGRFTRIGRMVFIWFDIRVTLIGTGSQSTVTGLPYSAASTGSLNIAFFTNLLTNAVYVSGLFSGTTFILCGLPGAGPSMSYAPAYFKDATTISGSGIYYVN